MGKPRLTKITSWDECPLLMTIEEVREYLGIGRPIVDRWFNDKTFPAISDGTRKVEKNNLRIWLDMKYGKYIYKNKMEELILEKIKDLVDVKSEVN